MSQQNDKYMKEAIRLSVENVEKGGGPFGAVIVKDGEIIARGANRVTSTNDPTAHAEVTAIREAAKVLNTFNLEGCEIFTSCEPCPMCLAAIYWARIDRIYFGNTKTDAKNIGFDDSFIYEEIEKPINQRAIKTTQLLRDEALQAFRKWDEFEGKVEY
ncbi:MAG TPA: nucleoside deaminase [Tenuifilaceae bacterium]|nr:nucleoside deaminase [Tenuifilaceae bacterium]HPE19676.1 nucleoside deaminase [Tenuifilaceae bacterium]HPJ46573.1 nucleoside deaminase [Tenuifilaceae bacterium]HPQ35928.1 nucleoside deaminase [Tenuifilaceae bacterium]HRX68377.1 nucleoside deaminase [Tenuifilaceae bacterium]